MANNASATLGRRSSWLLPLKSVQQAGGLDMCGLTYPCALSKGAEPADNANVCRHQKVYFVYKENCQAYRKST